LCTWNASISQEKSTYMFIMHGVITKTQGRFLSSDDGGVVGAQADVNSQAIALLSEDSVLLQDTTLTPSVPLNGPVRAEVDRRKERVYCNKSGLFST
jgi:hypothetical protein